MSARMDDGTPELVSVCPHFIVKGYRESVDYYREKLGFTAIIEAPKDDPYFAAVQRSRVTIAIRTRSTGSTAGRA